MDENAFNLLIISFEKINTFDEWNDKISKISSNKLKGDLFEYFTYYILKYHPEYKNKFKEVYYSYINQFILQNSIILFSK